MQISNLKFRIYDLSGQGLLALVVVMGGIILATGVAFALITVSIVNSTYGYQESITAEEGAQAAAEENLLDLERSNVFSSSGNGIYGSSTVTSVVTQNSPSAGFVTILTTGSVRGLWVRKVKVVLSENPITSQFTVVSWNEVQ